MKKQKTLPKLKKEALDIYAELVKLRAYQDGNLKCFTCSKPLILHSTDCQLGHYLSRGAYPGLTFHPDNSRPQCMRCNVWLHGNIIEFRERLIKNIGLCRLEILESLRHKQIKWSRSELLDLIAEYKTKITELSC